MSSFRLLLASSLLSITLAAPQYESWAAWSAPESVPTSTSSSIPATSATPISTQPAVSTSAPPAISTTTPVPENYACASVSALVATATAAVPTVPAQVAWDCLQSVPLNATAAVLWLESLKPYLAWQTTLVYLKNPPDGYLEPAIDVYALLDEMIANVDSYANEYELEFALYQIFQRTHDGHLRYLPTLIAGVATFGRPLALVSVSTDGQSLPQPYVYEDLLLAESGVSFEPSVVATINGDDAVAYLEDFSQYGTLQDPDALYNNLFYNLAQVSLGATGSGAGVFAGGGRGAYVWPNASTVLTFQNGSTSTYENFARILRPFANISTGQDIYNEYLVAPLPTQTAVASTPPATPTPAPGYPSPVIRQISNLIGGYYLDQAGYDDVAVLSVASFVGLLSDEESFQQVALDFLAQSKADGKTKLVIDISANGGGTILQGYSLFTNLFPDLVPYGATRFRAHQSFDIIGQVVSDVAGPVYPWNLTDPPGPDDILNDFLDTPFDYLADMDVNGNNFGSWAEKYGPHEYYGDNFTSIIRWNLSDPTSILTSGSGIIVNGYQNRTGIVPSRPYAAEDIVMLYDGYCASTCTIFSEFMRQQAGIKTIAIGGTPQYGQMQAVGGVKGTNDWPFQEVYYSANDTFTLSTPDQQAAFEDTELASYSTLPFVRSADNEGYVNARDGIRQGDTTGTPLQFVYEAADCRIFYEPAHTLDVSTMWRRAADVAWNGASCVVGSVGLSNSSTEGASEHKRHQRRAMAAEEFKALHQGVGLFTDLRGETVVGDGYMLP